MVLALTQIIKSLREAYEEWLWKNGPDRLELARTRLALHKEALAQGDPGPYLEPEKSNFY